MPDKAFLHSFTVLSLCSQNLSEKQAKEQFGEEQFWLHVQSGRLEWREDAWTAGVYNYRDRGDVTKRTRVRKDKEYTTGQEYEADEKEEGKFQALWGQDAMAHLAAAESFDYGKGKALTKGRQGQRQGQGQEQGHPTPCLDGSW